MIGKRTKSGMYPVWVYDPQIKSKRYVGQRATIAEAGLLEAQKIVEFAGARDTGWTIDLFAAKFLADYHGPNTKRPEPTTRKQNEQNLRRFRREHGQQLLVSFGRDDAHTWATTRPHEAKTIAAMYATAVDKGYTPTNPFARLGVPRSRGRADIDPLTERELELLAGIALKTAGHWGPELWALLLWMGWTGMRPGEVCGLDVRAHVNWDTLEVRVEENMRNDGTTGPTKGKQRREIVIAEQAAAAVLPLRRANGQLFRSPTGKPLRPNSLRYYFIPV